MKGNIIIPLLKKWEEVTIKLYKLSQHTTVLSFASML